MRRKNRIGSTVEEKMEEMYSPNKDQYIENLENGYQELWELDTEHQRYYQEQAKQSKGGSQTTLLLVIGLIALFAITKE